jgi:vancomycin resistance protein YoaR
MARAVDDPVREARIEYDGPQPVVVEPRAGAELDQQAAAAALIDAYLTTDDPVVLSPRPAVPLVSADEAAVAAETVALDAVSGPVAFEVGSTSVTVAPRQIAAVLSFKATSDGMTPNADGELLSELLASDLAAVGDEARDATFDVSSGTPRVVPARTGRGVSSESLARGLVEAIGTDERAAELTLERLEPDLTTAEAKDLGVTEVISSFTQEFPYAAYRVTNIGVASEKINGTVLEPGETFSLNGIVGERTPENGFVKGFVIQNGRLVEDYGGAVSTITTAMWHTAFYAGMTRLEQKAHSYWISRYIAGLEATVSWGSLDLKFRNDTPYGVFITSSVSDTSVTTTMWSTKYWEIDAEFGPRENITSPGTVYDSGDGCVAQTGVAGFDITVVRVWSRGGGVQRREPLRTSYNAAPTVICAPPPGEDKPDDRDKPNQSGRGDGGNDNDNDNGGGGNGADDGDNSNDKPGGNG